jgi:hypothetical protein
VTRRSEGNLEVEHGVVRGSRVLEETIDVCGDEVRVGAWDDDGVVLPCRADSHVSDAGTGFRIEDQGADVDSGTSEVPGDESAEVVLADPAEELDGGKGGDGHGRVEALAARGHLETKTVGVPGCVLGIT